MIILPLLFTPFLLTVVGTVVGCRDTASFVCMHMLSCFPCACLLCTSATHDGYWVVVNVAGF